MHTASICLFLISFAAEIASWQSAEKQKLLSTRADGTRGSLIFRNWICIQVEEIDRRRPSEDLQKEERIGEEFSELFSRVVVILGPPLLPDQPLRIGWCVAREIFSAIRCWLQTTLVHVRHPFSTRRFVSSPCSQRRSLSVPSRCSLYRVLCGITTAARGREICR